MTDEDQDSTFWGPERLERSLWHWVAAGLFALGLVSLAVWRWA
jgi:hypothetical protein